MAKGKRFYRNNNNASNEVAAGSQEGKPAGKPSGNSNRKPGGKPFRKFNGKENQNRNRNFRENRSESRQKTGMTERPRAKATGRVLVAYYSWSGVTEKAAQKIVAAVRGNSYRILPVNAYSSIYALCVAKAGVEKASGARPEIKGSLPDCSRYDKIAIGFPIWWFSCPAIIHSFLEKVKLDGKTVYPFCTSKTSGPRSSSADIRKTVPNAVVKECLDANKIESISDEDIKKWLEL